MESQVTLGSLKPVVADHSTMLGQIAVARASDDGKHRWVPSVRAIQDDQRSKQALVDIVKDGMTRTTGWLRIHNQTSSGQNLVINGGQLPTAYVGPT